MKPHWHEEPHLSREISKVAGESIKIYRDAKKCLHLIYKGKEFNFGLRERIGDWTKRNIKEHFRRMRGDYPAIVDEHFQKVIEAEEREEKHKDEEMKYFLKGDIEAGIRGRKHFHRR